MNWIEKHQVDYDKPPPVPGWMKPVLEEPASLINPNIKLIPMSGQYWYGLIPDQQERLLETVEWLGGDRDEYVGLMQKMIPKEPLEIQRRRK